MSILIFLIPLIIALYTLVFGIENWHNHNKVGFFALAFLAVSLVVFPFYLLFLR